MTFLSSRLQGEERDCTRACDSHQYFHFFKDANQTPNHINLLLDYRDTVTGDVKFLGALIQLSLHLENVL